MKPPPLVWGSRRVGQVGHRRTGRPRRGIAPIQIAVEGRAHHLASLPTSNSEAKWTDASKWVKAQLARTSNSKYRPSDEQKPNATSEQKARCEVEPTQRRATASRDNTCSGPREGQTPSAGGVTTRPKHESICSRTARSGKASRRLCGRWSEKKPAGAKSGSRSRSTSPTRDVARRS